MNHTNDHPDPSTPQQSDASQQHEPGTSITEGKPSEDNPANPDQGTGNASKKPTPPEVHMRAWEFVTRPEHANAIMAIFTVLIFFATGAYAVIATLQWYAMRGQLKQMEQQLPQLQKAAKAAEDSANLTRQQIVDSQAAVLGIRFDVLYRFLPGEAHGLRAIIDYRAGSATATNIHLGIDTSWKNAHDLTDVSPVQHFDFDIPLMNPKSDRSIIKMVPLAGLNPDTWEAIHPNIGHKTIAISGTFRYKNGFENVPDQHFCFVWFAHPEVLGSSAQDFIECERYASIVTMFAAFDKKKAAETKK